MYFYEILNCICEKKGITVTQLLKEHNLSTGNTGSWKKGKLPNGETLLKIADYLDCSVDYLLGRTDEPGVPHQLESKGATLELPAPLDEEDMSKVKSFIEFLLSSDKYSKKNA